MKTLILLAIIMATSNAMALSLKEQKQQKEWQAYLTDPDKSYIKAAKEKCGYDIPVSLDEKLVVPFMAGNSSAASYCDAARSAISGMCEDETSKASIKKDIKKIDCKLGKAEDVAFKLSGGTFTMSIGVGAANVETKVKEYLENNLK